MCAGQSKLAAALVLIWWLSLSVTARAESEHWRRVFTSEFFLVAINPASVSFEPNYILRARFRTVYSRPEAIIGQPGKKYKSRIETFEFRSTDRRYRIYEASLLDSSGKVVASSINLSGDWKIVKAGAITERMADAAYEASPLGYWKVLAYRYAEGGANRDGEPPELAKLIGARVKLGVEASEIGEKRCAWPAYQSHRLTEEELQRTLGTTFAALRIKANHVDIISVKCRSGWSTPQSTLIRSSENGLLMLWEGVFLVLKRTGFSHLATSHEILKE